MKDYKKLRDETRLKVKDIKAKKMTKSELETLKHPLRTNDRHEHAAISRVSKEAHRALKTGNFKA